MNYESMKTVYLPYSDIAVLQAPIHWQEEKKKNPPQDTVIFQCRCGLTSCFYSPWCRQDYFYFFIWLDTYLPKNHKVRAYEDDRIRFFKKYKTFATSVGSVVNLCRHLWKSIALLLLYYINLYPKHYHSMYIWEVICTLRYEWTLSILNSG